MRLIIPLLFFAQIAQSQTNLFTKQEGFSRRMSAVPQATYLHLNEGAAATLIATKPDSLTLTLPVDDTLTLALTRLRRKARIRTASGKKLPDDNLYYIGKIQGQKSLVALAINPRKVSGLVSIGGENYTLGEAGEAAYIYYPQSSVPAPLADCSTIDTITESPGASTTGASRMLIPGLKEIGMTVHTDYNIYTAMGNNATTVADYVTGLFVQVAALYEADSMNLYLNDLTVWDVTDPFTGPTSSNYLSQFRTYLNSTFSGDLACLLGTGGGGGIAYVDVLCNKFVGQSYCPLTLSYQAVPTYSWDVEVVSHEIGHNIGSAHTHSCAWNGNNTAIDGCGPTAGYSEGCTAPLPVGGGTIMSYCHLVSGVGINFANGFGPQPKALMQSRIANASCLATAEAPPSDEDCDGVDDSEDVCDGGDDSGPCWSSTVPTSYPASWSGGVGSCGCHRVLICYNGHTLNVMVKAANKLLGEGAWFGPCASCEE